MSDAVKVLRLPVETDVETNASYLRFTTNPVAVTKEVTDDVLVDLDADGAIVGIEVLSEIALNVKDSISEKGDNRMPFHNDDAVQYIISMNTPANKSSNMD